MTAVALVGAASIASITLSAAPAMAAKRPPTPPTTMVVASCSSIGGTMVTGAPKGTYWVIYSLYDFNQPYYWLGVDPTLPATAWAAVEGGPGKVPPNYPYEVATQPIYDYVVAEAVNRKGTVLATAERACNGYTGTGFPAAPLP